MKKKILFIFGALLLFSAAAASIETNKPDTHTTSWEVQHGKAAKTDMQDCLTCHDERLECIACHEDLAPRSHSVAWEQKNHGLESRWNRQNCSYCHKEDFCTACHESAVPVSHSRQGFSDPASGTFHCRTSCQLPYGYWKNTPSKNCVMCHRTRPILPTGAQHSIN